MMVGLCGGGVFVCFFKIVYRRDEGGVFWSQPPMEDLLWWIKAHYPQKDQIPPERLMQMTAGMRDECAGRDAAIEELKTAWPLPKVPTILLTSRRSDASLAKEISPEALQVLLAARKRWLPPLPTAL